MRGEDAELAGLILRFARVWRVSGVMDTSYVCDIGAWVMDLERALEGLRDQCRFRDAALVLA